jgi:hypothetical protein
MCFEIRIVSLGYWLGGPLAFEESESGDFSRGR